jgi:hypothetical protein
MGILKGREWWLNKIVVKKIWKNTEKREEQAKKRNEEGRRTRWKRKKGKRKGKRQKE